ncbi:hypothetical protein MMC29_002473 [Sticta canariensis]|nr:hypothetical protein [Sticta canariensis]
MNGHGTPFYDQTQTGLPILHGSDAIIMTNEASPQEETRAVVTGKVIPKGATKKGKVNLLPYGGLEWNNDGDWIPAVYHHTLRPEQIQQMDLIENLRARGVDHWDVTSYHPEQKTWGPCRSKHWPYMPGKLLFRLECNGYLVPEYTPGVWYDRGRVVLDIDNNPVKKRKNIPLTLASNADPWLLENIRREDTRITYEDLRARMPLQMNRFRMSAACPAWNEREGSDTLRNYVKDLLSPEGLMANSTQELRGLSRWQQAECKKPNKGIYPERAGKRALPVDERERRNEAETKRLKELCPWPNNEEPHEVEVQPARRKRDSRALRIAPSQRGDIDDSFTDFKVNLISMIELDVALLCSCFPILKPFAQRYLANRLRLDTSASKFKNHSAPAASSTVHPNKARRNWASGYRNEEFLASSYLVLGEDGKSDQSFTMTVLPVEEGN